MNRNFRKSAKLVLLLITSLIISLASVFAYNEMFMYGTDVTIGSAGVYFVAAANTTTMGGADAINTQGTVVTFDEIPDITPGEVRTYELAVNITNNGASAKTVNISLSSLTGPWSANFAEINVTMIDIGGNIKGNVLEIVSTGYGSNQTETGGQQIGAGETWRIRWIIRAKTDATIGASIDIAFKVKVE